MDEEKNNEERSARAVLMWKETIRRNWKYNVERSSKADSTFRVCVGKALNKNSSADIVIFVWTDSVIPQMQEMKREEKDGGRVAVE